MMKKLFLVTIVLMAVPGLLLARDYPTKPDQIPGYAGEVNASRIPTLP